MRPGDWVPAEVDPSRPSAARIYDYALGGAHNFAADRQVLDRITELFPATPQPAVDNRAFLYRAVRFCLAQGVRQFLDLGSGVPTVGNVHEVAHAVVPTARVVYVDIDPVAVAHSRRLLHDRPHAAIVHADLRDPDSVLHHPDTQALLDWQQPVAVLMVATAHYLHPAEDPAGVLAAYRAAMAPGSYLVFSHMTGDDFPEDMAQAVTVFNRHTAEHDRMTLRGHADITALLSEFELVPPGLVYPARWHPDPANSRPEHPELAAFYAAVARPRSAAASPGNAGLLAGAGQRSCGRGGDPRVYLTNGVSGVGCQ